jgi:hypothetical protein
LPHSTSVIPGLRVRREARSIATVGSHRARAYSQSQRKGNQPSCRRFTPAATAPRITPHQSLAFIGSVAARGGGPGADADAAALSITRLEGSRWRERRLRQRSVGVSHAQRPPRQRLRSSRQGAGHSCLLPYGVRQD